MASKMSDTKISGTKASGAKSRAANTSSTKAADATTATKAGKRAAPAAGDVEALLAALEHPHRQEILALRKIILGADTRIAEGVKWNSASFRTTEYFATVHLRAKKGVAIILHLGAKKRDVPGFAITDPEGLLHWLGDDRAMVSFSDMKDVERKQSAFENIIREWIGYVV